EREGVLVSWAVPKGIPPHPKENRMAVHTEDHPMEYLDFEGQIPEGEYGGGMVHLWDQGTYECEKWRDDEVIVVLHGQRARGRYALIKTKGKNWLMHRMDPPEDPAREPFPHGLRPMRWTTGPLPEDGPHGGGGGGGGKDWSYEPAWGGVHVLLACDGGRVELTDEDGADVTPRFPEFRALGRSLGALPVVLDGEVVRTGGEHAFFACDLVWLDGHSATSLPYRDRRRLLERIDFAGPGWRIGPSHEDGRALLAAAAEQGLAGVVSKAWEGRYEPGRISKSVVLTRAEMDGGEKDGG
ncbi:MAG TPA: DNA polymerase ligase N-terminal domain-containing protein, partial [Acidimicrobiales bacterium]|nr:DNA polymerase ligase N-terminal domain-containing protein [Acidimicrobiales bacterium]